MSDEQQRAQWEAEAHEEARAAAEAAEASSFDAPPCSVDRLKQYVVSAWIEAEAVCVATTETGPADAMMVFKARDMLREVLGVLNTSPPNEKLTHGIEEKI